MIERQDASDPELQAVVEILRAEDPDGARTARVLRDTLDQLYDGQRTGRYRWEELHKTEKTHCGTLVEINMQREFDFDDGVDLDYCIAGVDVDCKYSQRLGGWMIPLEARGRLCLLLWANDPSSRWAAGVVRATPGHLSEGGNRDSKVNLNRAGRDSITWLFRDQELSPNVLLQLPEADVERILNGPSGAARVRDLFRLAQQLRISRGVIATVAQQVDYMKRVRANGGARDALRPEGIVILGPWDSHRRIAIELEVPVPAADEMVSVRLTPTSTPGARTAQISGRFWRVAEPDDPVVPGPRLPDTSDRSA